MSKTRVLAEKLHADFCRLSHMDQCAWDYETMNWFSWKRGYTSVWDTPDHKRWLTEAEKYV